MLFYLYKSFPECILDLESVEALILERFQLYSVPAVLQYDTEEFNYYDRISHVLLCIMVAGSPYFKDVLFRGEVKLFREKLKILDESVIEKELSEASEFLENLSQSEEYAILKSVVSNQFQLIQNIIETLKSKASHCFKKSHLETCRKYKLILPFTIVLKLVSKRKVDVKNGKVRLSCGLWREILEVIFEFLLTVEVKLIENCDEVRKRIFESEDDRMRQIIKRFTNVLNGRLEEGEVAVGVNEIDELSQYFPPCMANLHQILRCTHRLSYDSRYQYTLFLKDIGLSVEDNILFWESEYRKPRKNSACTHDWKDNEKRYKYQIEYLYGLIHSRSHESKTSHPCGKFVGPLQLKMDGGCPFQHLTSEQLKAALPESMADLPDVEDMFSHKNDQMPQKACAVYLSCLKKVLADRGTGFSGDAANAYKYFDVVSPLQFYNIARKFRF